MTPTEHEGGLAQEARAAARGRSARTPLAVLAGVALVVGALAAAVTLAVALASWLAS